MTIGINGTGANLEHRVGIGQYNFGLLTALSKLAAPKTKFQIYLNTSAMPDLPQENENWKYKIFGPKKLWTLTGLQNKLIAEKLRGEVPDVFFTPTHYSPLYVPTKSVISIMEMSFEKFPQYFKKRDLYQLQNWTRISAKRARKILTISQFSKKEICRTYNLPLDRVVVTYPGYDSQRFNSKVSFESPKTKELIKKYALEQGYFVYLGTLQPRKNIEKLIEAFALLERKNLKLVIVGMINEGRGGWMYQPIFDRVKQLGLSDRVVFTGYMSDADVPYIFKGSLAYVLPSLYEGFGIPPVEAMATGVPVVVSKVSSLPEVCGPSAVYIDNPSEVSSIKKSLEKILFMKAGERVKRINLGLDWVKRYNWDETAKKTLEVLETV